MEFKPTQEERITRKFHRCSHYLKNSPTGISSQTRILKIINHHGPTSQHKLQERLGIQAGSLSEILTKMEARDLVKRVKDEEDRRKMKVLITDHGIKVLEESLLKRRKELGLFLSVLSKEEVDEFEGILDKLVEYIHMEDSK